MIFEIKNRFTGSVIFSLETTTFKLCIEAAIKNRANLFGANLSGADLSGADLSGANLYRADLSGADLSGADLSGADLSGANLSGANLYRANLYRADLSGADLSGADLSGANLYRANLYRADLSGADLSGANLYRANLYRANLFGANLSGANLKEAKISDLDLAKLKITPEEGAFVGWKKLKGGVIAQLIIPHDAKRMNAVGSRKCRASKVFVNEMFGADQAYDQHTGRLLYKKGEWIEPDSFDPDITEECSHGIHFFLTKIEAENY